MTAVPVSELFCSFQGEGPNLGRRALFARLMGCNLTCGYASPVRTSGPFDGVMACDTEYTWNAAKHDLARGVLRLTPQEIWDHLVSLDPSAADPSVAPVDLIVVSGGEPLLHRDALVFLARKASAEGREMEIETNATIRPGGELVGTGAAFNCGLKLSNSAVLAGKRIREEAIRDLQASGRARWKFVVTSLADLGEIAELQQAYGLTEVWLSPEGSTAAVVIERMRLVAEAALARGWHLTTREHVLIWGGGRGR